MTGIAYDDNGEPVPVAMPAENIGDACPCCARSYQSGKVADDQRHIREEALRDVLQWLAADDDVRRIGWRCALAHWLITRGETQEELAERLGVTGGRLSQKLKDFRTQKPLFLQGETAAATSTD